MLQKWSSRISRCLVENLDMNRSRAECFSNLVQAVLKARSVRLDDIASHIPGKAQFPSKTRRLQYFFQRVKIDYNCVAGMLLSLLGPLIGTRWVLAIDRTNWERRGNDVNLLTLSICLGDLAIPLFWADLCHKGNSDTEQRITLMTRFLEAFGRDSIHALTADREFVGGEWFRWLKKNQIPFVVRIKDNFKIPSTGGREIYVCNAFRNLKVGEYRCLGNRRVCGTELCVTGLRLHGNEYVIVVSDGVEPAQALSLYGKRWQIETLFQKLKGHGFDFEGSRLRGEGKAEILMAILAMATAWCYAFGEWHVREVAPLRIKSHGRREKSIFRRGLDILRQVLDGCASELARFSRIALSLLNRAEVTPHVGGG